MRIISKTDKIIIDRICEGHTHISVLLTDIIPDLIMSIDKDAQNIKMHFPRDLNDDQLDELATFQTEKIIYIFKFLQYLENEGYALSGYFAPSCRKSSEGSLVTFK